MACDIKQLLVIRCTVNAMQAQTNQSRVPPAGAPKAKWAKDWNNMVQRLSLIEYGIVSLVSLA